MALIVNMVVGRVEFAVAWIEFALTSIELAMAWLWHGHPLLPNRIRTFIVQIGANIAYMIMMTVVVSLVRRHGGARHAWC